MNSILYKQFEQDALQWVREAGSILIEQEQAFEITQRKDEFDIATSADVAVEKFLTSKILEKYPDHGIYGEEFGTTNSNAEYIWVLDPLDCTKEYIKGIGEYNCLVAVEYKQELVAGVIRRFGHSVYYTVSRANGAYQDGKPIRVSSTGSFNSSFIGMNIPNRKKCTDEQIDQQIKILAAFAKIVYRVRPGWDDAKLFSWVAQGALEACVSFPNNNKWFDVAPALLLVEEAGGKVTDWDGNPIVNHDLSKGIIVSNGLLHDKILAIIMETI